MDYGEQTTGTRDEHYNLVSVLYHALHGAENCDRYAADAEVTGDERLADFFRDAQAMQAQLAERTKELLGIPESLPEFGAAPGAAPGGCPARSRGRTGRLDGRSPATSGARGIARKRRASGHRARHRFPARRGGSAEGGAAAGRGEAREAYAVA